MNLKKIFKSLLPIFIGVLVAVIIKNCVITNIIVPTDSMYPTIIAGDMMIGSKLLYCFNEPTRGDIITFHSPEAPKTVLVKRIIGLPGETVTISSGKVYINTNETPLSEPYINLEDESFGDFGPYVVPADSYFVMGDNRNHSYDSRYWEKTNFVSRESITSKILFKYYSSGKFNLNKVH